MTSQPGWQAIPMHILPNISESKVIFTVKVTTRQVIFLLYSINWADADQIQMSDCLYLLRYWA